MQAGVGAGKQAEHWCRVQGLGQAGRELVQGVTPSNLATTKPDNHYQITPHPLTPVAHHHPSPTRPPHTCCPSLSSPPPPPLPPPHLSSIIIQPLG